MAVLDTPYKFHSSVGHLRPEHAPQRDRVCRELDALLKLDARLPHPRQFSVDINETGSSGSIEQVGRDCYLSINAETAAELTDQELRALVAHELGHILATDEFGGPTLRTSSSAARNGAALVLSVGGTPTFLHGCSELTKLLLEPGPAAFVLFTTLILTLGPLLLIAALLASSHLHARYQRMQHAVEYSCDAYGARQAGTEAAILMLTKVCRRNSDRITWHLHSASHPAPAARVRRLQASSPLSTGAAS